MQTKNYYLVSPKVDGYTTQGFIDTMFEQHIVMMGWGTDNKIGADFNNLNKGDFVIIAQRVNWVFKYYFAGIIDDEQGFSNDEGFLCRKLRSFIDLRGCNEDILSDVSFASMSVIKAMMNINPTNNIEIIKKLDKIIAMQENKDYVNSFVSLLKSNHNLILTGAPGTGKTYLAKTIAKEMGCDKEHIGFVQFHPSYDYTDFVEGLRPIKKGDTLGFERKDGVFKEFCKKALSSDYFNPKSTNDEWKEKIRKEYQKVYTEIQNGKLKYIPVERVKNGGNTKNVFIKKDMWGLTTGELRGRGNEGELPKMDYFDILIDNNLKTKEDFERYKQENGSINLRSLGINENDTDTRNIMMYLVNRILHQKPFVFIIDEINRGEISKIFGELFYSIDPGYRGTDGKVETQYQNLIPKDDIFNDGFYVPKNVYIIGTMNDIDRSVESMDFAMRRRFAWKEITAESRQSMLDEDDAWKLGKKPSNEVIEEMKVRMNNLNAAIIDQYGDENLNNKDKIGLSKAYQIGAAYFLKYALYNNFDDLWTNHLEGLLYEYLRGKTNIEEKIKRLQQAYNDTETH